MTKHNITKTIDRDIFTKQNFKKLDIAHEVLKYTSLVPAILYSFLFQSKSLFFTLQPFKETERKSSKSAMREKVLY